MRTVNPDLENELIRAVVDLQGELGRDPTATEVGKRLGITQQAARKRLLRAKREGLMEDRTRLISVGGWRLTPSGKMRGL